MNDVSKVDLGGAIFPAEVLCVGLVPPVRITERRDADVLRQKEMSLIEQLRPERRVGNLSCDDGSVGADGLEFQQLLGRARARKSCNPWFRNNTCR